MPTPEPDVASTRRETAWARLVERSWGVLVARAARRLDRSQAEDVVQDVFATAVAIAGGPEPPAWLGAWLEARVDYVCGVRRRRAARRAGRVVPLESGAGNTNFINPNDPHANDCAAAASILGADDVGVFVRAELARLDPAVRAAMERRWLAGRSVRQVARDLGVSKSAAEERLARGMSALRARLAALRREMER